MSERPDERSWTKRLVAALGRISTLPWSRSGAGVGAGSGSGTGSRPRGSGWRKGAPALAVLPLLGCRVDVYASFPQADRISFAPDDGYALVVRRDAQRGSMERYDLERREAAWTVPLSSALAGLTIASGGGHLVVVEPVPGTSTSRIGVYRPSDGGRVAQLERPGDPSAPALLWEETTERVAVSEDGRWLAVAGQSAFDLYALPGGERVVHEQHEGHRPQRVRFDAQARHVALAQRVPDRAKFREVIVFEHTADGWELRAELGDVAEPGWTTAGLLLLRETGIDRWRDGSRKVAIELGDGRVPKQFANDVPRSVHYAPDGRFAVVELPGRFVVADLEGGTIVYERAVRGERAGVQGAAVTATHATIFFGEALEGRLVRVDLRSGQAGAEQEWGTLGEYARSRAGFGERQDWKPAYWPQLSATGRYLALHRPDQGFRLHRVE